MFLGLSNRPLVSAEITSCTLVLRLSYGTFSTNIISLYLNVGCCYKIYDLSFLTQSLVYIDFSVERPGCIYTIIFPSASSES